MKEIRFPDKNKKINCCNDCGKKITLSEEMVDYQIKHMENEYVRVSCDDCIAKGHTLTDGELGLIKKGITN